MSQHTVRTFDEELRALATQIREMGLRAEHQYAVAVDALLHRDGEQARRALESDACLDENEAEITTTALSLLALRQPVAIDFREAIAAVKIAGDLERIGDLSKQLAKRATAIDPGFDGYGAFPQFADRVAGQLHEVVEAYGKRDADRAFDVWANDREVDDAFYQLYRALLDRMLADSAQIEPCTHLLFAAKNVERIGDHCANVADAVYYLVEGAPVPARRPKGRDPAVRDEAGAPLP